MDLHREFFGPPLRMEVGETVKVTVRNFEDRPYSFYPHGLNFKKQEEGYLYINPYSKTFFLLFHLYHFVCVCGCYCFCEEF